MRTITIITLNLVRNTALLGEKVMTSQVCIETICKTTNAQR